MTRPSPPPRAEEVPITVPLKEDPTPELLACAERPFGFAAAPGQPADTIHRGTQEALGRIMPTFKRNADRLDRWVNWLSPGMCPPPDT